MTCERCGKKKKKQVSDVVAATQLTVWITASKQFCLESSLECQQRWRRCDSGRQTVPHTCCSQRIRLMKVLVWPVATYGCESWTLGVRKNEETRLDAFEMKGLRKILRVS